MTPLRDRARPAKVYDCFDTDLTRRVAIEWKDTNEREVLEEHVYDAPTPDDTPRESFFTTTLSLASYRWAEDRGDPPVQVTSRPHRIRPIEGLGIELGHQVVLEGNLYATREHR